MHTPAVKPAVLVGAAAVALVAGVSAAAAARGAPVNVTPPSIVGEAVLGGTLTTDGGTWNNIPYGMARTYEWRACDASGASCKPIDRETGSSYVPKFFQVRPGGTIRVAVTAWSGGGVKTAVSGPVTIRGATAVMLEAPQVYGETRVGGTLTVSDGRWSSVEPWYLRKEWLRCWPDEPTSCTVIPYGRDSTLLVGPYDAGWLVSARVTAKTSSGASVVTTAPMRIEGAPPVRIALHASDLGVLVIGRPYDIPLWTGGTPPISYSLAGSVPLGMRVGPDGHLGGHPIHVADSRFGLELSDSRGLRLSDLTFSFRVITRYAAAHHFDEIARNVFGAAPTSGPCALTGTADAQAPAPTGEVDGWDLQVGTRTAIPLVQLGTRPYVVCTLAGSLPPGLAIDASGIVRGKPTRAGTYTMSYAVVDAAGRAGASSATVGFIVAPRPKAAHKPKAIPKQKKSKR